jgi:hypothetical protein
MHLDPVDTSPEPAVELWFSSAGVLDAEPEPDDWSAGDLAERLEDDDPAWIMAGVGMRS